MKWTLCFLSFILKIKKRHIRYKIKNMIMWMIKVFFFWQFNKITTVQKRITRDKNTQCTFFKIDQINSNFVRKSFEKLKKKLIVFNKLRQRQIDIHRIIKDNSVNCARCVDFSPWFFWRLKQIFNVIKCMDTFFDIMVFNILRYGIN